MGKYSNDQMIVDAIYDEQGPSLYKGNPAIEALPSVMPPEEIARELQYAVRSTIEERKLSAHERSEFIPTIYECFQPWGIHIELAQKVSKAIKSGYVGRNPLDSMHVRRLNDISECIQNRDYGFKSMGSKSGNAAGFCILGLSGTGKTTSINRVLKMYPQVIAHSNYKGNSFAYKQLVWMKLECPFDGSVKGLCSNFFRSLIN